MANFDQDAVDEAIRILQPQIDALVATPPVSVQRKAINLVITYDNGDVETYNAAP